MRRRRMEQTGSIAGLAARGGLMLSLVAALMLAAAPGATAQALGPFFGVDESEEDEESEPQRELLPEGFFDAVPQSAGDIAVEANDLTFDADANTVVATGNVRMSYEGYQASADRADYDRSTGELVLIGNAVVRDPQGVVYTGERMRVTGDFRDAFVNALAMQTADGALVTADSAEYRDRMVALLENGSYAPCGFCIDEKGNRIGWRVRSTTVVLNREEETLYLEKPTLELLGQPIATLPFYWLPDPTNPRAAGFRLPQYEYGEAYGVKLFVPYFHPVGPTTDLWLTPHLLTRQGFLLDAELTHDTGKGEFGVRGAGLYQLDRTPFAGEVGDRDLRGALQVWGDFTPTEDWSAGWSYLTFTDPGFIGDYDLDGWDSINDVYVQHLSDDTFLDARVQEFIDLGNTTDAEQNQQGLTVPLIQAEHYRDLPDGMGRVTVSGDLIGVHRARDDQSSRNGVTYIHGYEGQKVHGTVEANWSRQFILGGLAATPYLGLRGDAAGYDGASALRPTAETLFAATPIAALDMRFPLIARDAARSSYLFEPVAQISWWGSHTSRVGITNDNAHSFVFEDTNLFSFNRFTGSDRQETGLRANVGAQYQANFADGSWLRMIAGQSYHLAGVNAYDVADHAQVGNATGLGADASHVVGGVQAGFGAFWQVGGKLEVDPAGPTVARAALASEVAVNEVTFDSSYYYEAARPSRGSVDDTHRVAADLGVPFADYWRASGGLDYDLAVRDWTEVRAEVGYDDEYLYYGANYTAEHSPATGVVDHRFGIDFGLRGTEGL